MVLVLLSGSLAFLTSAICCCIAFFLERLVKLQRSLRKRIERTRTDLLSREAEVIRLRDRATNFVTSLNSESVHALYELNGLLGQVAEKLRRAENIYKCNRYFEYMDAIADLSEIEEGAVSTSSNTRSLCNWREHADSMLDTVGKGVAHSEALVKSVRRLSARRHLKTPTW